MEDITLNKVLTLFSENTAHPEDFLGIDKCMSDNLKSNIKHLYDFTKSQEDGTGSKSGGKGLKELTITNFDFEQIWQQIELQNEDVMDVAIKNLSTLLVNKRNLTFKTLNEENNTSEAEGKQSENDSSINTDSSDSDINELEDLKKSREFEEYHNSSASSQGSNDSDEENKQGISNNKTSVVDDDFFKLQEMEEFLKKEENPNVVKESDSESEEDDVDLFEEESEENSDDEAKIARFKDYFVARDEIEPKRKPNKLIQELEEEMSGSESEDDGELETEMKSTLELRQERLKRKIEDLEEQAVKEKPWQLKGEITAESRPQNSLLEEIVEFDLTSRPAPIITEQTSLQLEDIIRRRIKDKVFDSVEKISRPVETVLEYRKKLVLDQEKSKESLANIYEKEYLHQQAALETDKMDMPEEEPEVHKQVKKLMRNLFSKLDALSNFHFTSTPAVPELKVVSNLPAVNMEEVAPVAASEAALLAPEEIKTKPRGDIIGKLEKSSTDKKRERRKKKLKQKIHAKRKAKVENSIPKKHRVKA